MQRFLACVALTMFVGLPLAKLKAAPLPNQEMSELKKHQKKQRKTLKQQQHAMKKVMGQHEQSRESRKRFKHDLKMQRQMLRRSQKEESRRLMENRKSVKQPIRPSE
jgi:ABC-type transport system involved in cytochrome bd biosynthesis fused ATPase/permease subunit